MSRARFTQLDALCGSIDRLLSMVEALPYTRMKKAQQSLSSSSTESKEEVEEAQELAQEELTVQQWANMVFRNSSKTKPTDEIPTTYFILNEFDRFWDILNSSLGQGLQVLSNANSSSNSKKISYGSDDVMPFTATLLPNDNERLQRLHEKLYMLYEILEICDTHQKAKLRSKGNFIRSPYDLAKIHYSILNLYTAVGVAMNKQAVQVAAVSQDEIKQDEKFVAVKALLAQIDGPPSRYDLSYSPEKYNYITNAISMISGNFTVQASTSTNSNATVAPIATSASSASSTSSKDEVSAPVIVQLTAEAISAEDAKEYARFAKKKKVQSLFKTMNTLKEFQELSQSPESPELVYQLTVLSFIITMANTSERGYNVTSLFYSPSMLRIKQKETLYSLLNKKLEDSFTDFTLYNMKMATHGTIKHYQDLHNDHWLVDVTVNFYEKILQSAQTGRQCAMLAVSFDEFLETKNKEFRNSVLEAMNNRRLLAPLLERAYPVPKVREAVIAKSQFPVFNNTDRTLKLGNK